MQIHSEVYNKQICEIYINENLGDRLPKSLYGFSHSVFVFDANTRIFKPAIQEIIGFEKKVDYVELNVDGEASKSVKTYQYLIASVSKKIFYRRKSCFVAVGGGSVIDLVGYVAATFQRGVAYINIPTTLLAMIDASIGGKVGINIENGKHLIGSFHSPNSVLIDLSTLNHLPQRAFNAAFGEIIKLTLIAEDSIFFNRIERNVEALQMRDRDVLGRTIYDSILLKLKLVEPDWRENNLDRLLNLGHETAHALESALRYNDNLLMHGEAVAIGIVVASYIALKRNLLNEKVLYRIISLMKKLGCLRMLDFHLYEEEIATSLIKIREIRDGDLRVVLPSNQIGKAIVSHDVDVDEIVYSLLNLQKIVSIF